MASVFISKTIIGEEILKIDADTKFGKIIDLFNFHHLKMCLKIRDNCENCKFITKLSELYIWVHDKENAIKKLQELCY